MPAFPTDADLAQFEQRGIPCSEIDRQIAAIADPPSPIELLRPCRVGDGIRTLSAGEWRALEDEWRGAAGEERFLKFVPASGAATRMFAFLEAYLETGRPDSPHALRFVEQIDRLPFPGTRRELAELAALPKGLLPFHGYDDGSRTALAEQLWEATTHVGLPDGPYRTHFTVSPEHREQFAGAARALAAAFAAGGAAVEVGFSTQDPSTDTLALTQSGTPARTADGALMFRPAGHGALIGNLERTLGDLVFIKNIDNISRRERHAENGRWKRRLAGYLVRTQRQVAELLEELEGERFSAGSVKRGLALLETFGVVLEDAAADPEARRLALVERLDRPLRICGVVENRGEPGGGPFWARAGDTPPSPQIVEAAQIGAGDPAQEAIWRSATHFNPVDLVCALRDRRGRPYALERFVDPATSMVSTKRAGDLELRVLERPGLWNGAMAGWNTIFVEVPAETFTPVKTALDLLRPEHQQ